MKSRLFILAVCSAICLGLSVWLLWPKRNRFGNVDMETKIGECTMSSGVVARLYEGNGGATTSFWYSVTVEGPSHKPERQVFFAYASPMLETLSCQSGELLVNGEGKTFALKEQEFEFLRGNPTTIWRGDQRVSSTQPTEALAYALAALSAVGVTGVGLRSYRQRASPRKQNAA